MNLISLIIFLLVIQAAFLGVIAYGVARMARKERR